MTWIRIDPNEMSATASALQGTASELAFIGGDIQGQCGSCCLPPTVESQILATAAAIQAGLGALSSDLTATANDLTNRGALAANDSLATAASSASGPGALLGPSTVGGDWSPSDWLLGTDAPTTATIGGSWAGTGDWTSGMDAPTTATIGGSWAGTGDWTSGMSAPTYATIGPATYSGGLGGLPLAGYFNANAHDIDIWTNPSRSELMGVGPDYHYISPEEYVQSGYRGQVY